MSAPRSKPRPLSLRTLGTLDLRDTDGMEIRAVLAQPKRLALLAYLAVSAPTGYQRRDSLLALFWPETDESRGRAALSTAIHFLRRSLGDEVIISRGVDDVGVSESLLNCDCVAMQEAARRGDDHEVLALYAGAFLDGFHVSGAPEFEHWLTAEKERLRTMAADAAWRVIEWAEAEARVDEGIAAARRALDISDADERAAAKLIRLLSGSGDRLGALRVFEWFSERLKSAFDLEPSPELVRLVQAIRGTGQTTAATTATDSTAAPDRSSGRLQASADIAVLPFENYSADPADAYVADGLSEELIEVLSGIRDLRVCARTSSFAYRSQRLNAQQIGDALGVEWLVEGSVRKAGNRLRITVRLLHTGAGDAVWSQRYDADAGNVLEMQEQIASAIVDSLVTLLGHQFAGRVERRQTDNPEAYFRFLYGRYHYNARTRDGLATSVASLRSAVELDPGYALARAALADALVAQSQFQYAVPRDVLPEAEEQVKRALELDPGRGEPHATLAHILDTFHWKWEDAEREYRTSIRLNARHALGRVFYAELLTALGRHDEAAAQMRLAQSMEPLSVPFRFVAGSQQYRARRFGLAERTLRETIELFPGYFPAHAFLAMSLAYSGRPEAGLEHATRAIESLGPVPGVVAVVGIVAALAGRGTAAHEQAGVLADLKRRGIYVPAFMQACLHAALADPDEAFRLLDRAMDERQGLLMFAGVEPALDPIRSDPRFARILGTLGLPGS